MQEKLSSLSSAGYANGVRQTNLRVPGSSPMGGWDIPAIGCKSLHDLGSNYGVLERGHCHISSENIPQRISKC